MEISISEVKEQWEKTTKPTVEKCHVTLKHDVNLTRALEKILNRVDTDILTAEKEEGFEYNVFETIPDLCLVLRPTIGVITAATYKDHTKECTEEEKKLITKLGEDLSVLYKLIQYAPTKQDKETIKRPRINNDQATTVDDIYGIDKKNVRKNYNFNV